MRRWFLSLRVAACALLALRTVHAGFYPKSSVLEVNAKTYPSLIAKSNHTSIVKFYAPWCPHCETLKPAYEKAAKFLDGLAKVAAVDCDDQVNKAFCGSMGVRGFPTLKIVRPAQAAGKQPLVQDYQGGRKANEIAEAVLSRINNHVTKVTDKTLDRFLQTSNPKLILFTEKGKTSALLKSIAIDYLGIISVAQIRNVEKTAIAKFGINKFPSLILLTGQDEEPLVYDGELKKEGLMGFLARIGPRNPDSVPNSGRATGDGKSRRSFPKSGTEEKSANQPLSESRQPVSPKGTATTVAAAPPTPSETLRLVPLPAISSHDELETKCLQLKSRTCVLAIIPSVSTEASERAIHNLAHINTKYLEGKRHFPLFSISQEMTDDKIREAFHLGSDVELIAMNARRRWWCQYQGDFGSEGIESWFDAMRMGEAKKKDLPSVLLVGKAETTLGDTSSAAGSPSSPSTSPDPKM